MHYSVQGRAVMLAAVMPLLFVGCADLGPTAVVVPAQSGVISLDVGSGPFRLDIGRRELWHPDGRVVDLKIDETEWLATEFAAQAELASSLASTMTSHDAGGCDWHMQSCEDATLRLQSTSTSQVAFLSPASTSLLDGAAPTDASNGSGRADFERTYGKIKIRISRNRPSSALRAADPDALRSHHAWSCADLKIAIDSASAEAQQRRLTWRGLFNKVFGWTGFTLDDGILRGTFGQGSRGAVQDAVESMTTHRVNLALTILQGLYVQMGCGTLTTASTPHEGLPPDWEERCEDVWGTIILPGNVVYTGWFKECELVKAT